MNNKVRKCEKEARQSSQVGFKFFSSKKGIENKSCIRQCRLGDDVDRI
jgi:hypothetical protein